MIRVAINGFGSIGRAFTRLASDAPEVDIVAVNDPGGVENLAYLLRYDSVHGRFSHDVRCVRGRILRFQNDLAGMEGLAGVKGILPIRHAGENRHPEHSAKDLDPGFRLPPE